MTALFVTVAVAVLARGFVDPSVRPAPAPDTDGGRSAVLLVVLAFPVAMALATGVEAASTAIAQLGQLDDRGRRRFGRGTLLLLLGIVGGLTIALAWLATRLGVGLPAGDSTQIADLARAAVGDGGLFGLFQLSSALLLLAAASSSFQAGPGLLKALARDPTGGRAGILPAALGRTNRHHTPYLAVLAYFGIAALIILAAAGREQELVLFYAVAVFVGFLSGLLAMTRFASQERDHTIVVVNSLAILAVTFTLVVNVARGYPLASLLATGLIAGLLHRQWRRAERPGGTETVERATELA